ncbi:MAG: SRPBCC domain-containing protein [Gemmatimonadaceae bacterium]
MAGNRTLVMEREMPFPPEKIWRALTEGSLLSQWLMNNDFEPVVGHSFEFRSTPMPNWDGVIKSKVIVVEPNRELSYSWSSLGLESIVVWTLAATSAGTLVRMEQSGFRDDQDFAYKGANYGWQKFIGALERVVGGLQ